MRYPDEICHMLATIQRLLLECQSNGFPGHLAHLTSGLELKPILVNIQLYFRVS